RRARGRPRPQLHNAPAAQCPDAIGCGPCPALRATSWNDRYGSREPPPPTSTCSVVDACLPPGDIERTARIRDSENRVVLQFLRLVEFSLGLDLVSAGLDSLGVKPV